MSKWELGETTPEMDKLIKISEVFNITLDELIKDEKVNEKTNNKNFQQLAGMVIKILKGLGIFLIILFVIIIIGSDKHGFTNIIFIIVNYYYLFNRSNICLFI